MFCNLAQRAQRAQVLWSDHRRTGDALLQRREDLDPLDRVDAQVGIHAHVQFQHFDRIAGLLGHHRQQGFGDVVGYGCRCC